MTDTQHPPIAQALGRIPCGLYIVTTAGADGRPLGFVGSFVMQQGFAPPTLSVAIGQGRDHLARVRATGRFTISVLDKDSSGVMGAFFRKLPDGETPFDSLETLTTEGGGTVLSNALAWMDCRLTGEFETGDHVICFGEVESAAMTREGEPQVHLRANGLGY